MEMIKRNYQSDVSLSEITNLEDANECVASFFVSLRLALNDAGIMTYGDYDTTHKIIQNAEDSIRKELWRLMP